MAQLKRIGDAYYVASNVGEIIHPLMADAVAESHRLYVEQLPNVNAESLRVWDVGLGIGSNVSALLNHFIAQKHSAAPKLEIVSFDISLEYAQLAIANANKFPSLQISALEQIVTKHQWQNEQRTLTWNLTLGDFCSTLHQELAPDFIMFDPFSRRENPAMWETAVFEQIFKHLEGKSCRLVTYATHPDIRASLSQAGFMVKDGHSVGRRKKSTIAEANI